VRRSGNWGRWAAADVITGGVGRAGAGYDFVCADDREVRGACGDGDGAFCVRFGVATAFAGVWMEQKNPYLKRLAAGGILGAFSV